MLCSETSVILALTAFGIVRRVLQIGIIQPICTTKWSLLWAVCTTKRVKEKLLNREQYKFLQNKCGAVETTPLNLLYCGRIEVDGVLSTLIALHCDLVSDVGGWNMEEMYQCHLNRCLCRSKPWWGGVFILLRHHTGRKLMEICIESVCLPYFVALNCDVRMKKNMCSTKFVLCICACDCTYKYFIEEAGAKIKDDTAVPLLCLL